MTQHHLAATDALLARIDAGLAAAPSSDLSQAGGWLARDARDSVAERGLCWRCCRRPSDPEGASELCGRCRAQLWTGQGPDSDWSAPEAEAPGRLFGARIGPHTCATDGCRCGGRARREAEAFDELTRHAVRAWMLT